jgi:hypothetical protein
MNVYIDLNIFDRIEKKEKLEISEKTIYTEIENLILEKKIIVPYSNAHLNDLFRGFQKNPDYIDGHLNYIKKLTNDLCICQYWGRNEATWHFRKIEEFFEEKKNEWEFEPTSFLEVLKFDEIPNAPNLAELYKLIPLPPEFKKGYSVDPMFGIMYPKSRIENNRLALMEDVFDFQSRLKSDYSLYKSFKSYLVQSLTKHRNNPEMLKSIKSNFEGLPKHLDIFEISELYEPKSKTSENNAYSKIIETFYKYDLQGYKTDSNFNNMFDDALHTFYASHCDFFITNDDRCKYKAEKTFEKLKIKTQVIKAEEYEKIKNCH